MVTTTQHVWHPFTQALTATPPIKIIKGRGSFLYAEDGSRYLDAISSWWVNLHGHAHPYIAKKISEQAFELEHAIFAGFTHPRAIELTDRLIPILPGEMEHIFYSDNGSTAVEVALKIALQYWHNQHIKKTKIICFQGGYHGDTFGAMSAGGKNDFNRPFWNHLFDVTSILPPIKGQEEQSFNELKNALADNTAACFYLSP